MHRGTALSLGWVDDGSQPAPDGSRHGRRAVPRLCLPRLELRPAGRGSADPGGPRPVDPDSRSRGALRDDRRRRASSGFCWIPVRAAGRIPSAAYPLPQADSWWEQPGFRTIPIETYDWACSAARRVENFVDFSHFPWVHPDVLGDRSKPLSPDHEVIDADGVTISFDIALEEPQASRQGRRRAGREGPARPDDLHAPPAAVGDARPAAAAVGRSARGQPLHPVPRRAPLSARRCRSFTWNARTYALEPEKDAELAAFQALILDQDRPIAESQRPEELPVDLSQELHIAGPDKASIAYRRRLAELAATAPPS